MNKQDFLDRFNAPNLLKEVFSDYIKDKSVPLEDRWEVFCAAPDDFSIHEGCQYHFDREEDDFGEISWYDDFYYDRHQTVHMESLIDKIQDKVNDRFSPKWNLEVLQNFKEEILSKNLKSFVNDW